jgi:hypothetical protein
MTVRLSPTGGGLWSLDIISELPVTAPEIVEFWSENLRVQFNARLGIQDVIEKSRGLAHIIFSGLISFVGPEPPRKRRRTSPLSPEADRETFPQADDADLNMNVDLGKGGSPSVLAFD